MKLFNSIRFNINKYNSYRSMKIRSVKEIFDKKMEIQNEFLKQQREDSDTTLIESQLNILKWVLRE